MSPHFPDTSPLFLFNQDGDLERAMLRRGDHASAKFWRRVLLPVIERYRHLDIPKLFRGDGQCMACGQKTIPKPVCGGGVWHQPHPEKPDARR